MSATTLYTPEILGLATSLSDFPWRQDLPLQTSARSRSCGSGIELGLGIDSDGRIDSIGLRSRACAIGQAAAAIFARAAMGRDAREIAQTVEDLNSWLAGEGPLPLWPGMDLLAPAQAYPGRHGAIRLPWQAAHELLPTGGRQG